MASPFANIKKTLKKGSKGGEVKSLQKELAKRMKVNVKADGELGPATEKLIKDFQKKHKLKQDGVLGPKGLAMLGSLADGAKGAADQVSGKLAKFQGQKVVFKIFKASHAEMQKDLAYWREVVAELRDLINDADDDAALSQYDLQQAMARLMQAMQAMTAAQKKWNDAANTIIKNMR